MQPKQSVVATDARHFPDSSEIRINIITQVRIVFNTASGTMRIADGQRPRDFHGAVLSGEIKRPAEDGVLWGGDKRGYAGAWRESAVAAKVAVNRNNLSKAELSFRGTRGVVERPERRRHVAL